MVGRDKESRIPNPTDNLEVLPGSNAGIRETSARDVVTLWFFTTAFRECRDPWAAKLSPENESNRVKASVTMWNLVSTAMAASSSAHHGAMFSRRDRRCVLYRFAVTEQNCDDRHSRRRGLRRQAPPRTRWAWQIVASAPFDLQRILY